MSVLEQRMKSIQSKLGKR